MDPVIIELPPDKPFDHASYIDHITMDRHGIAQVKNRAKEVMNAYYNAAIIERFQKGTYSTSLILLLLLLRTIFAINCALRSLA